MKKLSLWVAANLFYVYLGSCVIGFSTVEHAWYSYGFYVFLILNIIIGIKLYKKGYHKKNIIYVLMLVFAILGVIATIFAFSKRDSIFGAPNRDEGLLMILYYLSVMYLSSLLDKKYRKRIIIFVLICGVFECLYGICQAYELPFVRTLYNCKDKYTFHDCLAKEVWVTGFMRNPNFFGAYMLICLGYAVGMYFDEKTKKMAILYLVLILLFAGGIIMSNTMSCVVGALVMLGLALIFVLKNRQLKRFLILAMTLTVVVTAVIIQGKTRLVRDTGEVISQTSEMMQGNVEGRFGTGRIYIWQNTMKIVPQYLWHGVGIDNFKYAFDGGYLLSERGDYAYDKAHNEYLQILVAEGIFALVVYLAICVLVLYSGARYSFKNKTLLFILPVVGYMVQAFMNISVIEVAPFFFMAMGFCINNKNSGIKMVKEKNEDEVSEVVEVSDEA